MGDERNVHRKFKLKVDGSIRGDIDRLTSLFDQVYHTRKEAPTKFSIALTTDNGPEKDGEKPFGQVLQTRKASPSPTDQIFPVN